MIDPLLFAVPIQHETKSRVFSHEHHRRFFGAASIETPTAIRSRESTIEIGDGDIAAADADMTISSFKQYDRLELRLDDELLDARKGWVFGTNSETCDVLILGVPGISRSHFHLNFDDAGNPVLIDQSTNGTAVAFESEHRPVAQRGESWLLAWAGQPTSGAPDDILVTTGPFTPTFKMRVLFPNHGRSIVDYETTLAAKIESRKTAISSMEPLSLDSGVTTVAATPPLAPISIKSLYWTPYKLGEGSFANVYRMIHKTTMESFALRVGTDLAVQLEAWMDSIRKEVDIMRLHPHPNIMRVCDFVEESDPKLLMPYFEHGNLAEWVMATEEHHVEAFCQALQGLQHLHANKVVHRDLKPENLLVALEPKFTIVISDFGLSKAMENEQLLKTFCGSPLYCAPEVYPIFGSAYGCEVDIWSLGTILLELVYKFPKTPETDKRYTPKLGQIAWGNSWCDTLIRSVHELEDEDLLGQLLRHMVVKSPERRYTSTECLKQGLQTGLFTWKEDHYEATVQPAKVDSGNVTPKQAMQRHSRFE